MILFENLIKVIELNLGIKNIVLFYKMEKKRYLLEAKDKI